MWGVPLDIFGCALYMAFSPQPDITTFELAYICSRNGCLSHVCMSQARYDSLEPGIKRHFKQEN
jgi:hypothetical protein